MDLQVASLQPLVKGIARAPGLFGDDPFGFTQGWFK